MKLINAQDGNDSEEEFSFHDKCIILSKSVIDPSLVDLMMTTKIAKEIMAKYFLNLKKKSFTNQETVLKYWNFFKAMVISVKTVILLVNFHNWSLLCIICVRACVYACAQERKRSRNWETESYAVYSPNFCYVFNHFTQYTAVKPLRHYAFLSEKKIWKQRNIIKELEK